MKVKLISFTLNIVELKVNHECSDSGVGLLYVFNIIKLIITTKRKRLSIFKILNRLRLQAAGNIVYYVNYLLYV